MILITIDENSDQAKNITQCDIRNLLLYMSSCGHSNVAIKIGSIYRGEIKLTMCDKNGSIIK